MGKRIKLTKTDLYLLGLTMLFAASLALTWVLTPHQVRGDYQITAETPAETVEPLLPVNINTADVEELDTLPGIGPVLAQRIVDWRTANGAFAAPEDLMLVDGIGEATWENIRDFIITEETEE